MIGLIKIMVFHKILDCKIRIMNKKTFREIYIGPLSNEINNLTKIKVEHILTNCQIDDFIIGHDDIYIKINEKYGIILLYKLIKEIGKYLGRNNFELIEFIRIDADGKIIIKPNKMNFSLIYRAGKQVTDSAIFILT
jgi:hypothetical protein